MSIRLEHISKTFPNNKKIFSDVNITFKENGIYILSGRSGSGKTTLLNILAALDFNYEGHYYLNDKLIDNNTKKYISYLSEDSNFLNDFSVKDNLKLFNEDLNKINEVLLKVSLLDKLEENVNVLSKGEKVRLNIAIALLKDTNIILLDEPTSNLDIDNAKKVIEILKEISKTKLIIVATHDDLLLNDKLINIINVSEYINYDDVDSLITLKEINVPKIKSSFISRYSFKRFKKNIFTNLSYILLLSILFAVNILLFSIYNSKYKDYAYNYIVENDISYISVISNDNDIEDKASQLNLNYYHAYDAVIDGLYDVAVYVTNEKIDGVIISNDINEFYKFNYKISDDISFVVKDKTFKYKINKIEQQNLNDNVYENYIIVSIDNFNIDYDYDYLTFDDDIIKVLTFAENNKLFLNLEGLESKKMYDYISRSNLLTK